MFIFWFKFIFRSKIQFTLDHIANINENNGCNLKDENIFHNVETGDTAGVSISPCLLPIVHIADEDEVLTSTCLQAALQHPSPPVVISEVRGGYSTPQLVNNNRTLVLTIDNGGDILSRLHVEVDLRSLAISSYTYDTINLEELPAEYKDADYIEDMTYLRTLADDALANDPVVGITGFMPMTRTIIRSDWRMCMGGECPIGNLFTDALRWAGGADFAVLNSGGLRGEGWPAGEVHVSDLWSALPFVNHICTGVMSGVSVFRLLNFSTSVATFESTYTKMGDRLLQMSGMKMTYNTLLNGTGPGRLISVDVWDRQKKEYLPLERLKLYKFASDNWMCDHFDPYPSLLGSELVMKGEVPGTVDDSRQVQDIVGAYLTQLNETYDTTLRGSHVNDTEALEPLAFIQSSESCRGDQIWEAETLTCMTCPDGEHVKFSEDLISFLIIPHSKDFTGRNVLSNRELFNVTVSLKSTPDWIVLQNTAWVEQRESKTEFIKGSTLLQPGESIAIDFDIDASTLSKGNTRSTISFGMGMEGNYRGCLSNLDITFDTVIEKRSEENFNHLGSIRAVGLTLMGLAMVLSLFFSAWTYKNRSHRIVKLSQPHFLQLICAGTFIMAACIVPLSIDDGIASNQGCDIACMSTPWLLSMGFATVFSALFAKIWRVHKVVNSARSMLRVVVRERDAMRPIVVVFLINIVLLVCWTMIDPLRWQREYINGDPTNSHGFCKSEGNAWKAFSSLLVLLNGAALVLACVQAYRARSLDDEYTESRWLGMACASWIQVMLVGIPVILLTRYQPVAQYFTFSALVFIICVSMLGLLFVPKMMLMSKPQETQSQVYQPGLATPTGRSPRNSALNRIVAWKKDNSKTYPTSSSEDQLQQRILELEESLRAEKRLNGKLNEVTDDGKEELNRAPNSCSSSRVHKSVKFAQPSDSCRVNDGPVTAVVNSIDNKKQPSPAEGMDNTNTSPKAEKEATADNNAQVGDIEEAMVASDSDCDSEFFNYLNSS